jgi:hypothetical protein
LNLSDVVPKLQTEALPFQPSRLSFGLSSQPSFTVKENFLMATKYPFDTVLPESEQIARVWAENPTFSLGEITLANLQTKIRDTQEKRNQVETLRTQLTALTNDLNVQINELAGITTRARSGFRAVYGPDSTQYEQAGGTRSSERKRPSKRKPTAPAS